MQEGFALMQTEHPAFYGPHGINCALLRNKLSLWENRKYAIQEQAQQDFKFLYF